MYVQLWQFLYCFPVSLDLWETFPHLEYLHLMVSTEPMDPIGDAMEPLEAFGVCWLERWIAPLVGVVLLVLGFVWKDTLRGGGSGGRLAGSLPSLRRRKCDIGYWIGLAGLVLAE